MYDRGHPSTDPFNDLANGLIFQKNGIEWKQCRHFFDQFFTSTCIRSYYPMLSRYGDILENILEKQNETGSGFDIEPIFQHISFDVISELVFGSGKTQCLIDGGSKYLDAFTYCLEDATNRFLQRAFLPSFLIWESAKYKQQIKLFRSLVTDSIDNHAPRNDQSLKNSMLGTLLESQNVPEFLKNEKNMITHLVSILFAGHDTTKNLMTWLTHFLSINQDVQDRLYLELSSITINNQVQIDKLDSLTLLNHIVKETLRLRPSAVELARVPIKDHVVTWTDETGKERSHTLRKGSLISYNVFQTHHHPSNWIDRPNEFLPDRWLEPKGGAASEYCFVPFGFGPRRCLGEKLALLEAKYVLSRIMSRWNILPVDGWKVEVSQAAVMGTRNGLGVVLRERS